MDTHAFFKIILLRFVTGLFSGFAASVLADANNIDKVYHPYVQQDEIEIEYRLIRQDDNKDALDSLFKPRLGVAYSPTDRLKLEFYIIGEDTHNESFTINAFEWETKIQLTEQGEYWADWGLLFELDKKRNDELWEFASSVLIEKEWGRWVGTANVSLAYEWGNDINNELEGALAMQGRYRFSRFLEPAIEFYSGQDTLGIGPVLLGQLRLGQMKKLRWEMGVIVGLDDKTPDRTFRALLEFEF